MTASAQHDAYAVSAEFYDILQAQEDETEVQRLYGHDVAKARLGVLDVGAGTGRVTVMSLLRSGADVHSVEPARAMRAALMTRLASLPAELRARVTVHPEKLDEAELRDVADVAICHNTIACLAPAARRALWPALAQALVPDGSLLLQLPPAHLPAQETVRVFAKQWVGQHEYGGRMVMSVEAGRIRTRCDYWVRGSAGGLREHTETFWLWPASRIEMISELAEHGFVLRPARDDPAVVAMTLVRR
ncbi:class I SAM-dependent methyltransferase [Streptomyces sp. NPDC006923]|uniref:class I SAM-dependent methyltransferase n=1 Tax=Streptomyces sp. NPDC006923 TaxID=3155355 RepID=UPI0033FFC9E0